MAHFMSQAHDQLGVPISIFADNPLVLAPEDYPNQVWHQMSGQYNNWWSYYKGYILNRKNEKGVEVFPVKLNIIRSAVINHAAVLLGQFDDDQIVQFGVKSNIGINDDIRESTGRILNLLWSINNGDDLALEASLLQQVFGGAFIKCAWHPTRKKWPIRFFTVDPRAVYPVWDGDDYNRLVSIDVYHQIPRPTATVRFRVTLTGDMGFTSDAQPDYVTVHEHWDENEYWIKIDEQFGRWPDGSEMRGPNPFMDPVLGLPIIPYVYAPRIRVGEFWGESVVPGLIGPQDEINDNLAHLGEGLADSMHQQPWVRNRAKGTQGLDGKSRSEFLDLGMTQAGSKEPEIGRLKGAEFNPAITDYVTEDLVKVARESNNMPDVAFGRTDASIRSALTLKFMMWPTINVGLRYRKHFSTALKQLNYYALVMMASKRQVAASLASLGMSAVSEKMIEAVILGHKTNFAPMLPDDRVDLVQEMVQRMTAGIVSPESAVRRLDGSDDLEAELNRIDEHREKISKAEQELAQVTADAKARQFDQSRQQTNDGSSDRTTRAQASGGRKSDG